MKNLKSFWCGVAVGVGALLLAGCVGVLVLPGASAPIETPVCSK